MCIVKAAAQSRTADTERTGTAVIISEDHMVDIIDAVNKLDMKWRSDPLRRILDHLLTVVVKELTVRGITLGNSATKRIVAEGRTSDTVCSL